MAARLQRLCRAVFSLGGAASTSAPMAAQLGPAGAPGLRAAAAWSGGGVQQAACSAAGLRQLARHIHTSSLGLRAAADEPLPAMNPLQQAPTPSVPGAPFGMPVPAEDDSYRTVRHVRKDLTISPRKLNDFAKVVRGLHIRDAIIQCTISPKKASRLVREALLSARGKAVQGEGLDADRLRVVEAWVGQGSHLKRISLHGRGRAGSRRKYRSHLTVVVREEDREPRMRTRVVPMLAERHKLWDLRAARGVPPPRRQQQ